MKTKKKLTRVLSFGLVVIMLSAIIPTNMTVANAATSTVSLTSLGRKGTISIGSKKKTGTWWQMKLNGKKAFCMNLGYTCHSGNTYEAEETHHWDQDTGGAKNGYYAKVIRWYVIDKNRSNKAFLMSQALIWSIAEGRNSENDLKDIISQVKRNLKIYTNKPDNEIYNEIFHPGGKWTASVTSWQKTGNSKHYQRLLTVNAEDEPDIYEPSKISDSSYYRQRITVKKKDEDGKNLSGIQFTLKADNLDDLYSFSMTDRDGTESNDADDDNDTSFSMTGYTRDTGRIAFRMTYRMATMEYYYYTDSDLAKMTSEDKKAAKRYLIERMDLDEGVDFGSDMTKASAQKLMDQEMNELRNDISNTYTLTEDNTGENKHIVKDPEFAAGKRITLKKENSWVKNEDGVWPDSLQEVASDYYLAYSTGVTNNYKKATIDVVKIDQYSKDKKPHGDARLDGAEFQLYEDVSCTSRATVYNSDGTAKTAGIYTVENQKLVTDFLRSGITYYLKEVKAPVGYTITNNVLPITVDATGVTAEYTYDLATKEFGNTPKLGRVAVQKYDSSGQTGPLHPEANAIFQVYLTRKGSYNACDEYERALIQTNENGYGVSGDLYYGEYTIHQVNSGEVDAVLVEDITDVRITEDGDLKLYPMNNNLFKAYLRIVKRDGNTEKQVLKPGTAYQIYRVTDTGEELVEQSYSNGNKQETVSQFITDESGEIMTVKELISGTYRIYETDSATGLHITDQYIEVEINGKAGNYESFKDEDGYTHAVVTVTYINEETYGKLKVYKTGEMLTDYRDGKFVYENRFLKGVVFEIYAAEDIVTQDNQGTNWYEKDDLVAVITTGEGAVFEKDCKNITGYTVNDDGTVSVNLPLGKYYVREKNTRYGYVLPDKQWDVEFIWNNKDEEYVLNATDSTDENGVFRVENARAKTQVSLFKTDETTKQAVEGAEFGIFTRHDIYNVDGEKIVVAGAQLGTVTTDAAGKAVSDIDFPLMSEGYVPAVDSVAEEDGLGAGDTPEKDVETKPVSSLNSGDYFLKELSVSDSYYCNETEYPVHLEFKDQETKVVAKDVEVENKQTTTVISKTAVMNSEELAGCGLQITDAEGNVIVKWISGNKESIVLNEKLESMGYRNMSVCVNEKGAVQIGGLFHGAAYTLTETKPADGYVTADSISFRLIQGEKQQTLVAVLQGESTMLQSDNVVHMVDDTTKVEISKTDIAGSEEIPGCELEIKEKDTDTVVETWTSTKQKHLIEQKFIAGKTYVLTEKRPAAGYVTADRIEFTVQDTGEIQSVQMKDDTTKIRLIKLADDTGQGLRAAKFEVYDSEGNKVLDFLSGADGGCDITGKLAVGETYTFKEIEAPKGYQLAKPVKYTIKDTGDIQEISVTDKKIPNSNVPQTGENNPFAMMAVLLSIYVGSYVIFFLRKRSTDENKGETAR